MAINSQFKHLIEVCTREHYCPQSECSSCQIDFVYNLVQWDARAHRKPAANTAARGNFCDIFWLPKLEFKTTEEVLFFFCLDPTLSDCQIITQGKTEDNSYPLEFTLAYIPKLNYSPKKVLKLHLMKNFGTHQINNISNSYFQMLPTRQPVLSS